MLFTSARWLSSLGKHVYSVQAASLILAACFMLWLLFVRESGRSIYLMCKKPSMRRKIQFFLIALLYALVCFIVFAATNESKGNILVSCYYE
jgi:ABC-type Fe3+ transport system permease subunit